MKKRRLTQHANIGPLSAKSLQLPHYVPPKQEWPANARVTNAGSTGTYNQAAEWAGAALRPGALDFMQCKSRGAGC